MAPFRSALQLFLLCSLRAAIRSMHASVGWQWPEVLSCGLDPGLSAQQKPWTLFVVTALTRQAAALHQQFLVDLEGSLVFTAAAGAGWYGSTGLLVCLDPPVGAAREPPTNAESPGETDNDIWDFSIERSETRRRYTHVLCLQR